MVLKNVTTIYGTAPVNIQAKCGKITPVNNNAVDTLELTFDNALVFPGLVNSHDHLDFNLFPQLGDRLYNNYTEWGACIHKDHKEEIAAVLKVPLNLRVSWGIFKNLLCGFTTVVNHGAQLAIIDAPITIEQGNSLHSVQFEKGWKLKLNNPLKRKLPLAIHVGEGTDELAHNEIDELIAWNLLNRKLTGVHGVAMTEGQAKSFEALVWCPESNYFLLNKTAPINQLKKSTTILFGTDSTLTGNWNIWHHIRLARKTNQLTDDELYNSLQAVGGNQSVVVVNRRAGETPIESFFATDPADILLVVHEENIRMFDETMLGQLPLIDLKQFSRIYINGAGKYVQGNLPELMRQIKAYYPQVRFPITSL